MTEVKQRNFEDRCRGTMLGLACGDALGAPAEFKTEAKIKEQYGLITQYYEFGRRNWSPGSYTDDAEQALSVAESLLECNGVDPVHMGKRLAANCMTQPCRGYGPNTRKKYDLIHNYSFDPRLTGDNADSNGAITRVPPIGLFIAAQDRESPVRDQLRKLVEQCLTCTHRAPEAIESACIVVSYIYLLSSGFTPTGVRQIVTGMPPENETLANNLTWIFGHLDADRQYAMDVLIQDAGEPLGRYFAIRAVDCLSIALWLFHRFDQEPELAVVNAVNMGGDADSVASLVGALCGAAYGCSWIPRRWRHNLENAKAFDTLGKRIAALKGGKACGSIQQPISS